MCPLKKFYCCLFLSCLSSSSIVSSLLHCPTALGIPLINKHLSARSVGRKSHSSNDVVVISACGDNSIVKQFPAEKKNLQCSFDLQFFVLFLFLVTVD